jgi:hypothetical protein
LPRPVVRHVAAPARFEDIDPEPGQMLVARQDVRPASIAAHAKRQDGRMFDQQQQIRYVTGAPLFDKRALHRQRFRVRHETQTADFQGTQ